MVHAPLGGSCHADRTKWHNQHKLAQTGTNGHIFFCAAGLFVTSVQGGKLTCPLFLPAKKIRDKNVVQLYGDVDVLALFSC